MGVTKTTTQEGTGAQPQKQQTVTIEYTGYLKKADGSKGTVYVPFTHPREAASSYQSNNPSRREKSTKANDILTTSFDSSVGKSDFRTPIGVGRVIRGWDEGVVTMKVGEKATLDITADYAYGSQ